MTDFSLDQAISTQKRMRDLLGLEEERFPLPAFIGMLSDEVEKLRATGRSDADIASLIGETTGKTIAAEDVSRYYAPPEERHGHGG